MLTLTHEQNMHNINSEQKNWTKVIILIAASHTTTPTIPFSPKSTNPFCSVCSEQFWPGAVWEVENARHGLVWPRYAGETQRDGTTLRHEDPQQAEGQSGSGGSQWNRGVFKYVCHWRSLGYCLYRIGHWNHGSVINGKTVLTQGLGLLWKSSNKRCLEIIVHACTHCARHRETTNPSASLLFSFPKVGKMTWYSSPSIISWVSAYVFRFSPISQWCSL